MSAARALALGLAAAAGGSAGRCRGKPFRVFCSHHAVLTAKQRSRDDAEHCKACIRARRRAARANSAARVAARNRRAEQWFLRAMINGRAGYAKDIPQQGLAALPVDALAPYLRRI
eukprot:gene4471-3001_t